MEVRKLYAPKLSVDPFNSFEVVLFEEHQAAMAEMRKELETAKAELAVYEQAVKDTRQIESISLDAPYPCR